MANGNVLYSYYNNYGKYCKPGLKNRRKSHWAKIRQAELREKERKEAAAEQSYREWEQQFDNPY